MTYYSSLTSSLNFSFREDYGFLFLSYIWTPVWRPKERFNRTDHTKETFHLTGGRDDFWRELTVFNALWIPIL